MFNILDASDSSSHGSAPRPQNQENPSSAAPLTNGFHIHAVAKAVAPLKRMVLHLQTSDQFGSGCVGKLVSRRFEWTHNIWVCSKCKPVAYGVQILRGGPCKGPRLAGPPNELGCAIFLMHRIPRLTAVLLGPRITSNGGLQPPQPPTCPCSPWCPSVLSLPSQENARGKILPLRDCMRQSRWGERKMTQVGPHAQKNFRKPRLGDNGVPAFRLGPSKAYKAAGTPGTPAKCCPYRLATL